VGETVGGSLFVGGEEDGTREVLHVAMEFSGESGGEAREEFGGAAVEAGSAVDEDDVIVAGDAAGGGFGGRGEGDRGVAGVDEGSQDAGGGGFAGGGRAGDLEDGEIARCVGRGGRTEGGEQPDEDAEPGRSVVFETQEIAEGFETVERSLPIARVRLEG
jgi:hypothetical protein